MQSDSRTRFIPIGLMLFALFFGAGNLIFPASMGQAAGTDGWAFASPASVCLYSP